MYGNKGTGSGKGSFHATSSRAKAERKITRKQSKKWPRRETDARMANRMVELIIKYTTYPEYVHGPIEAMELDKGGTVRWIQRKPNCKGN